MSTLEPAAAGVLLVAGAAWGLAAGAGRPHRAHAAASALAGPSVLAPDVGGQAISAGGGATAAAGIYLLREAVRRRSRKLPRSAARAPQ